MVGRPPISTNRFLVAIVIEGTVEMRPIEPDPDGVDIARPRPGVARIKIPLPYSVVASVNVYVLELDSGPALVDCGTSRGLGWEGLATGLMQLGIEPGDIS